MNSKMPENNDLAKTEERSNLPVWGAILALLAAVSVSSLIGIFYVIRPVASPSIYAEPTGKDDKGVTGIFTTDSIAKGLKELDGDVEKSVKIAEIAGFSVAGLSLAVSIALVGFAVQGIGSNQETREIVQQVRHQTERLSDELRDRRNEILSDFKGIRSDFKEVQKQADDFNSKISEKLKLMLASIPDEIERVKEQLRTIFHAADRDDDSRVFNFYNHLPLRDRNELSYEEYVLAPLMFLDLRSKLNPDKADRHSSYDDEWSEITHGFAILNASKCYDNGLYLYGASFEKAVMFFELSMQRNSANTLAQNDFGMMLFCLEGNVSQADLYHRRAVEVLEDLVKEKKAKYQRAYMHLAWAYSVCGRPQDAFDVLATRGLDEMHFSEKTLSPRPGTVAIAKACIYSKNSSSFPARSNELLDTALTALKFACLHPTVDVYRIVPEETLEKRELWPLLTDPKHGSDAWSCVNLLLAKIPQSRTSTQL